MFLLGLLHAMAQFGSSSAATATAGKVSATKTTAALTTRQVNSLLSFFIIPTKNQLFYFISFN